MIFYRLAKRPFRALDGEGARLYGGRWNSAGRPMIYCAASPSLAVLEVLVHLDLSPDLMPLDYHLLSIEIPDDAPLMRLATRPEAAAECLAVGDEFLRRGEELALLVPSAIVPQEINALVNPRHPAAARVATVWDETFRFDPRLA